MDYSFENRYIGSHKMLAEFARKHAVGPRPWTWVIFAPLSVFLLLALLSELDAQTKQMAAYFFVFLILLQLLPHYYAWSIIRQDKKRTTEKLWNR